MSSHFGKPREPLTVGQGIDRRRLSGHHLFTLTRCTPRSIWKLAFPSGSLALGQMTQRTLDVYVGGHWRFKHHQNSTRRHKEWNLGEGKTTILWGPTRDHSTPDRSSPGPSSLLQTLPLLSPEPSWPGWLGWPAPSHSPTGPPSPEPSAGQTKISRVLFILPLSTSTLVFSIINLQLEATALTLCRRHHFSTLVGIAVPWAATLCTLFLLSSEAVFSGQQRVQQSGVDGQVQVLRTIDAHLAASSEYQVGASHMKLAGALLAFIFLTALSNPCATIAFDQTPWLKPSQFASSLWSCVLECCRPFWSVFTVVSGPRPFVNIRRTLRP